MKQDNLKSSRNYNLKSKTRVVADTILVSESTSLTVIQRTRSRLLSEINLEDWLHQITPLIYRALKNYKKMKIKNLKLTTKALTVVIVGRAEMKKINHQFRGKDYATDVLSFSAEDPIAAGFPKGFAMGELVICSQVIQKQAKEHGLSYQQEMLYMLIHGILHLLGYDHELGPRQEKQMFQIQDEIFDSLCKKLDL